MCMECNMEFPSIEAYIAHKNSGHTIPGIKIDAVSPPKTDPAIPPNVPPEAIADNDFIQKVEAIKQREAEKFKLSQHKEEMQKEAARIQANTPKPKKVELTYLYIGDCPDDGSHVMTLEVDIGIKHFAIAVCNSCKKQLDSKEVVKL